MVLLIQVEEGGDLLDGLSSTVGQQPSFLPSRRLEFQTAAIDKRTAVALMAGVTRSGAQRMVAIRSALALSHYFALPLSKREGVDQMSADRISVGRALNKDIVLRDESVSKFHAWFELHEGRDFSLADAGSTNQTCVNGEALVARQLQPLSDGDSLNFGAINGLICSAESLWSAIHDD